MTMECKAALVQVRKPLPASARAAQPNLFAFIYLIYFLCIL